MTYKMKCLPLAILRVIASGTFSALAIAPALAQQATSDQTQAIQRVEITGSNIKSSDKATANNIQVITAAEIQESGQTTVADYLHTISANFASFHENNTLSFSPGASGIALRGLSQKNTLVLVDGQRTANYGLAQNIQDTYFDLNTLPVNAVDHIDVLLEGASAIYGSDAVGGVVNIILKTNYKGAEADIQYGAAGSNSMATTQSSITTGFGNLQDDGYNVMFAGSVFHRDDLLASQRSLTSSEDTRSLPGGLFAWQQAGWYLSDANPAAPYSAFPLCGQNGYPGAVVSASLFPGVATGTQCAYNNANQLSLIPGTDRATIAMTGNLKIGNAMTAFGDVFIAAVKTKAYIGPATLNATSVVYNGTTGSVSPVGNTLPVGNASNPGTEPQDIGYNFQPVGSQYYQNNSYTSRITGGLKGSLSADWDWQASIGLSENNVGTTNYNGINVPALESAIANNTYNFVNPGLTPGGINAIRIQYEQAAVSRLETLDGKITGALFSLPAGDVQSAFGYEFRHESLLNQPDSKLETGEILNVGSTAVDGARSVNAIYGELEAPLLTTLTGNLALREEKYSDFGSNLAPMLKLRFQPVDILTFKGAYSLGFRAPSLPEISHASATYFTGVSDPQDPLGHPSELTAGVNAGNPNLKAEKSKNVDLGFVLSPTRDLSFAIDYYRIDINNIIAPDAVPQEIVDNPDQYPGQIVRTPGGLLEYVLTPYANLYRLYTRGEDVDGKYVFHLNTESKLTTDLHFTIVEHLDINTSPDGQLQNFAGTDGWLWESPVGGGGAVPRLRGNLAQSWENHDWLVRINGNYTSGYTSVVCEAGGCPGADGAIAANIHSYITYDLFAQYKGFKNWTLSASVTDLDNKFPPYDAGQASNFGITSAVSPELYDLTGRFINFRAAYKF